VKPRRKKSDSISTTLGIRTFGVDMTALLRYTSDRFKEQAEKKDDDVVAEMCASVIRVQRID
jgi:hypothetical protein